MWLTYEYATRRFTSGCTIATSAPLAQNAAQEISGSVLLTRRGYGHTSYGTSACAGAAIEAYFLELTVPANGTVCNS